MTGTTKPATIYDVARVAGVSHQSVSRVLRDIPGVKADTRERVEAALRELDYRPSVVARELASPRRSRIGVVGYETFESSTAKVLKGINEVATREGYVLEIVSVDPLGDVDDIARRLDSINAMDVVGLLATSPTAPVREALSRSVFRMPVFLDVHGDEDLDSGRSLSAVLVMEHLIELGHRTIAHVGGPQTWDTALRRRAAYEGVLTAHGLPVLPIVEGDWSARSGYAAARQLRLDGGETAIFVANDRMALGVLRALSERGIRVPDDVSVAGIDDIPEAEFFSPPLTTVHVDFEGTGRAAAETLLALIRDPDAPLPEYPPRRFIARASTAISKTGLRD
jgi:DNA-binding LacI/PurR family transcriptional regulator